MAESSLKSGRPGPGSDAASQVSRLGKSGLAQRPLAGRYRFADLTIDAGAGSLKRGDEAISLSPLTFDLLLALVRRAPDVVRRQDLLSTVWPEEFVNDDTLSQRVRLLREAIGDVTDEPRYVASVRGWGYKIVPNVERLEEQAAPVRALAVLPLANLSGDPQQEYFADGMTETLISTLARIGALKIISRTSVMRYKNADRPLPEIARELGVDAVIEGTVLVDGRRVRVSVQLIRAAADEHVWAGAYDRALEDVLALHAELAQAIAHKIQAVITPVERERLEKHHRVDPVAHESELRARFFFAKFTPADLDRAIAYFEQAIAQDPAFPHPLAGLASVSFARAVPLGGDLSVPGQRALLSRAKAAAKQALSIDDTLAEAHAALGMILLFHDWDWKEAERSLDSALELDSNSWMARLFRGGLAATVLDRARTLAEMRRAIELDPLNLPLYAEAAECCFWIRDYAQAAAYASQALELAPAFPRAHFVLGRVYEAEGRIAEAITAYQQAGVITSGARTALRAFEEDGAPGFYRWALRAGITMTPHTPGALRERPIFLARALARLGEVDESIRCLERAYEQRECLLVLLKPQWWYDPLRSDPRFIDLVRRIGIP